MIWNSWPMEVIGREGTMGKNKKKIFQASLMQPQKKEKWCWVLMTISFVTPYKKAIFKFVVHFNNSKNITLVHSRKHPRVPEYRSVLPSLQQCCGYCCSTTLPTAKWSAEVKERHIKPVIFPQQCLLRDTGGLDFITIKFERVKYDNWNNTETGCRSSFWRI